MSALKRLIIANWKMNGSLATIDQLVQKIINNPPLDGVAEVVLCAPFVYLAELNKILKSNAIKLGAQNVSHFPAGAYTGEISTSMLKDFFCDYVIVGHSERRLGFAESSHNVAEKSLAVQDAGMVPIVCVGETLAQRKSGESESVIKSQLDAVLDILPTMEDVVIAYEPVWAIGTGEAATPEYADHIHKFIRSIIALRYNAMAEEIRILYGGSIKADNASQLFNMENIDGGLVGGASLVAEEFLKICHVN